MPQRTRPDNLTLYRHAVQYPLADVAFLERAYAHHNDGAAPLLLREDFCGTSAVSAAFVASDEDRQAVAIDHDTATLAWADQHLMSELGERAEDVHLVASDVMAFHGPRVDAVASLNFSTFIWHDAASLVRYFRHVKRCLRPGGVFVMDLFGGRSATTLGVQSRAIEPDDFSLPGYTYHWEQYAFDAASNRIDCRIHFEVDGQAVRDAFVYDWRLWSPIELVEHATAAGLGHATVWGTSDQAGPSTGRFTPHATLDAQGFVAYLTAVRV